MLALGALEDFLDDRELIGCAGAQGGGSTAAMLRAVERQGALRRGQSVDGAAALGVKAGCARFIRPLVPSVP